MIVFIRGICLAENFVNVNVFFVAARIIPVIVADLSCIGGVGRKRGEGCYGLPQAFHALAMTRKWERI